MSICLIVSRARPISAQIAIACRVSGGVSIDHVYTFRLTGGIPVRKPQVLLNCIANEETMELLLISKNYFHAEGSGALLNYE